MDEIAKSIQKLCDESRKNVLELLLYKINIKRDKELTVNDVIEMIEEMMK